MCGRFTREYSWQDVHDFLDLKFPAGLKVGDPEDLDKSWNVAPTQSSLIAHRSEGSDAAELTVRRWGLIPHWAKEASIGNRMINARAETAAEKPAFRVAFSKRRCVVPISSFFEWEKIEGQKTKRPWRFVRADGKIILLAGLFEPPNEHADRGTFTILTTQANDFMSTIHDRMPVILEPEDAPSGVISTPTRTRHLSCSGPRPTGCSRVTWCRRRSTARGTTSRGWWTRWSKGRPKVGPVGSAETPAAGTRTS
ncbi:MAG: SOS response-associated peptidase [Phycisphaerales bacterium]